MHAAIAAVIAELEFGKHYFLDGADVTADDVIKHLRAVEADFEVNGGEPAPIRFSRSHVVTDSDEFTIARRSPSLEGMPYDSLSEGPARH
ncbi:hypothetical protein BH11ACT4_BH11ACT4_04010 [soil metagenome]